MIGLKWCFRCCLCAARGYPATCIIFFSNLQWKLIITEWACYTHTHTRIFLNIKTMWNRAVVLPVQKLFPQCRASTWCGGMRKITRIQKKKWIEEEKLAQSNYVWAAHIYSHTHTHIQRDSIPALWQSPKGLYLEIIARLFRRNYL